MMSFQDLAANWRAGDPAVRHKIKWNSFRWWIKEKALFQSRIIGQRNPNRLLGGGHETANRAVDLAADLFQALDLCVCEP